MRPTLSAPSPARPRAGGAWSPTGGGGRRSARRAAALRCALPALALLLLLAAVSWAAAPLYPATVAEARGWAARRPAAAAAAAAAPAAALSVGLVVSRFSGNLSWVPSVVALLGAHNVTVSVYCKNPAAPPGAVPCSSTLPNVGNEGHTYLSHLVAHWATLPDLLLLLPDTVEYGDKLKTWRRRNLARHGRGVYYADDYTPVSGARFAVNWLNAVFYGPNFPCRDHRRGGAECVYHGHTGANPGGALTPATPPLFPDWLAAHLGGATEADVRACGWGNRGMLAVSRAAVLARPREFYANLVEQLGQAAFPMAGMFMERMWRHTFLCANWRPGGRGRAGGRASGGDARGVRVG